MSLAQAFKAEEQFKELREVSGQRGYAVLDFEGNVIQSHGELDVSLEGVKDRVESVHSMLQDVRGILQKEKFKKLEVRHDAIVYLITMSPTHIFILKKDTD